MIGVGLTFMDVVGGVAGVIGFCLASLACRASTSGAPKDIVGEFANPGWRTMMYLVSAGLGYYYPLGDDPVKWAHLVVLSGVCVGYLRGLSLRGAPSNSAK